MAKLYDLVIIGAGPGGYTAALKGAKLGMSVLVIDKDKLGGVCVNKGCIPTKALLHASSIFSMMQHCDEFGVFSDFISFDFSKMQNYKKRSVQKYRSEIMEEFEQYGIRLVKGIATIRRNRTIEINGSEGKEYVEGKHIIIATGAKAALPKIPGMDLPGVLTSGKLQSTANWNFDRIVIIGGGVVGVEFATIFNSLCSKVAIIEKGPHLLGPMDYEVSQELERELRKKGITIYCNAEIKELTRNEGMLNCRLLHEGKEINTKSPIILAAVGRRPYMVDLIGNDIEFELENNRLKVDADFMTSQPEIYAIGDVVAKTQLAHVAAAQGTYVVEKIAKKSHSIKLSVVPNGMYVDLPIVPNCIYTDPEIATVGITVEIAKANNMKVRCGRYSMSNNGKSIISREEGGFIRLIFEAYSNNIVGAQIVCPRATDMIGELATAIANGLTAEQLSLAMRAHPTYSEGITAAIEDAMHSEVI